MPSIPPSSVSTYFVPPPIIPTLREKIDINKDKDLRKQVTDFFYRKSKKWMEDDNDFKKTKKNLSLIKSNEGYNIIYQLIRKFVKKYKVNWYDIRKYHYSLIKKYLKKKLSKKI